MPISPKRMPFLEHMGELRRRLAIIVAVLAVVTVSLYFVADRVYGFLTAPVHDIVGDTTYILTIFGSMMARLTVSFWAAIVMSSPIIIWQVMAFFLPALKPKERRFVVPTFFAMVALFAIGMTFCYEIILHAGFYWLKEQAGTTFTYMPTGMDLIQSILYFLLGFGLAFQTPVVVFYLVFFRIVPYKTLRQNWRIAYVIIAVTASIATPDWSPVTMGLLTVAMIALYELSLLLVRAALRKRIADQQAALEAE